MSEGPFSRRRLVGLIQALRGDLSSGLVGQSMRLGVCVTKTPANVASADLFTVTGQVMLLHLIGRVTTVIQAQACNAKVTYDPTGAGADTDLCANLDVNAGAVGVWYSITGTLATAMQSGIRRAALMATPQHLEDGKVKLVTSATNTGVIAWTACYIPVTAGATLVAA